MRLTFPGVDPFHEVYCPSEQQKAVAAGGQVSESRRRTERQLVQYHRNAITIRGAASSKQHWIWNLCCHTARILTELLTLSWLITFSSVKSEAVLSRSVTYDNTKQADQFAEANVDLAKFVKPISNCVVSGYLSTPLSSGVHRHDIPAITSRWLHLSTAVPPNWRATA